MLLLYWFAPTRLLSLITSDNALRVDVTFTMVSFACDITKSVPYEGLCFLPSCQPTSFASSQDPSLPR